MARIECDIEECLVENPKGGKPMDGMCVTCGMCDTSVEGTGSLDDQNSVKELLGKLRAACPYKENNRYTILNA